jgi:hypothetical protein
MENPATSVVPDGPTQYNVPPDKNQPSCVPKGKPDVTNPKKYVENVAN